MAGYVVRSPVRWGKSDGSVVELQPGDSLPGEMTDEERDELVAAGSVVPAETHKAVEQHDEKVKKLQEKRAELDAEYGRLLSEEGELQAEAEQRLEEAKAAPAKSAQEAKAPESKASESKATTQLKPAAQTESKSDAKK